MYICIRKYIYEKMKANPWTMGISISNTINPVTLAQVCLTILYGSTVQNKSVYSLADGHFAWAPGKREPSQMVSKNPNGLVNSFPCTWVEWPFFKCSDGSLGTRQLRSTFCCTGDVEKLHAAVARSTFPSQNAKKLTVSERSTFPSQNAKKLTEHVFEVPMSKDYKQLWRERISKSKC